MLIRSKHLGYLIISQDIKLSGQSPCYNSCKPLFQPVTFENFNELVARMTTVCEKLHTAAKNLDPTLLGVNIGGLSLATPDSNTDTVNACSLLQQWLSDHSVPPVSGRSWVRSPTASYQRHYKSGTRCFTWLAHIRIIGLASLSSQTSFKNWVGFHPEWAVESD